MRVIEIYQKEGDDITSHRSDKDSLSYKFEDFDDDKIITVEDKKRNFELVKEKVTTYMTKEFIGQRDIQLGTFIKHKLLAKRFFVS